MRFHEKYEIQNIDRNDILHSSFWRIGEEFGYDLILEPLTRTLGDINQKIPSLFSSLKTRKTHRLGLITNNFYVVPEKSK